MCTAIPVRSPFDELTLAGVNAGAQRHIELRGASWMSALDERACAANRASGAVEADEEAVPGVLDLATVEPPQGWVRTNSS
jgi:hypothetical protein